MKIDFIQISNVLSFKYYVDVNDAPKIEFEDGVNILIGQNGSGKSTALEVINFIFKKVLFVSYNVNHESYARRDAINLNDRRSILQAHNHEKYHREFRLEPNWHSEREPQTIRIQIRLDDIDKKNIQLLLDNNSKLDSVRSVYSNDNFTSSYTKDIFQIDIVLDGVNKTFQLKGDHNDAGLQYLVRYNYYRELINLYNRENPKDMIPELHESFTLIGGYRNYSSFSPTVSLAEEAATQLQRISQSESGRSSNSTDGGEPSIFNVVRLRAADKHFNLVFTDRSEAAALQLANDEEFLKEINEKLKLINLKVQIKLERKNVWAYSFKFHDLKTARVIDNINSLSAGQKSIIHLIFEAYGRGKINGGVVVIDEPEIHLHYQFQYEYLRILEKLKDEQKSQYILVTHSEALISSETIGRIKRFALDENKNSVVKHPAISADTKTLVKILDNTKSTYAFFAKKVLLVEGDSDRYFFKGFLSKVRPDLSQEIAVLDIGGKGNYHSWRDLFESFGLEVFYIGDFDNVFSLEVDGSALLTQGDYETFAEAEKQSALDNLNADQQSRLKARHDALIADTNFLSKPQRALWKPLFETFGNLAQSTRSGIISKVKAAHPNLTNQIDALYAKKVFILKHGALEDYAGTKNKSLSEIIKVCENFDTWLNRGDDKVKEIQAIFQQITS